MDAGEGFGYICAEGAARKRLVMSQRRYEGACNRIADANVTFCERGGAVKHVTGFSVKKNRNKRNLFRRGCRGGI